MAVLAADLQAIMASNLVPDAFSVWLAANGVITIKNFAIVAISPDKFETDVIDGCRLLTLGTKSHVRGA